MTARHLLPAAAVALAAFTACSDGTQTETAGTDRTAALKEILTARHSVRAYTDEVLTESQALDVCWAANGVNREDGKRTAPSAINAQDIDIFVCQQDGAWRYVAEEKRLEKVCDTDVRPLVLGRNEWGLGQTCFLLVSDQEKFARLDASAALRLGALDAGYVSENICLWATAAGLATCPCAVNTDLDAVREALSLPATSMPFIVHPVGREIIN